MVLTNPLDPMYRALSSFLLAKPAMDLFVVPEFNRLFFSKEAKDYKAEQVRTRTKGNGIRMT